MKKVIYYGHTTPTLIGGLIRFVTRSVFNHISINIEGEIFEMSAIKNGARKSNRIRNDVSIIFTPYFKKAHYYTYLAKLNDCVRSSKYAYLGAILVLFNIGSKRSSSSLSCDQIASYPFEYLMDLPRAYKISLKRATPKSFLYYLNGFQAGKDYYCHEKENT